MEELKFCFALKTAEPAKARVRSASDLTQGGLHWLVRRTHELSCPLLRIAQEMLKTLAVVPPSPTEGTVWKARPATDPGLVPRATKGDR